MKAGKLGLLSVVLVLGLSACNLLGGGEPTDPTDPTDPTTTTDPSDPTTPSGGPTDPTDPGTPVAGAFGVSESATGPWSYSGGDQPNITDDSDPRVISVAPGGSFYAQAAVDADAPVEAIEVLLVNSAPAGIRGPLSAGADREGFTLAGEPTCDPALGSSNTVTCTFQVNVAADAVDIEDVAGSEDEFAWVFRHAYTVGGEQTEDTIYRGYVNIE